jgi:hypothetical protein
MEVKTYPFNIYVKDRFSGEKVYIVTDAVTDKIIFLTTQKKVLKEVLDSIFFKKNS